MKKPNTDDKLTEVESIVFNTNKNISDLSLARIWFLPILILYVTFVSVNQWNTTQIGNTTITWIFSFLTIISVLWCKRNYFSPKNRKDYFIVKIYLIWMLIGVIRGCFVADNYWEWKQLIHASLALSLPVFVYAFTIPDILCKTLRVWIKVALPVFGVFFFWVVNHGAFQHYLGPVLLIGCFIPVLPKKWKIIFVILLVLMMVIELNSRSQIIKAGIVLLISISYMLSKYIPNRLLSFAHWMCYIVPVVLLYLGIAGIFNVFIGIQESADGKYATESEDLANDTRTFIYEEVILSAKLNNYIWQGRTPARGNDSRFGDFLAEDLGTGKYERFYNEVCHPNVFTWLGLIGMLLYSLIYLKSSYLALYKSNNLWIKFIGVFIAFRWAYGWIEDINMFNIMNITLWMLISMGFSEQFRQMSDNECKKWVLKIINNKNNSNSQS